MGRGPYHNGRHQPITPFAGSWAQQNAAKRRVPVTHAAFCVCQQILQGEGLDRVVRDAATEAIDGYRSGKGIDRDVAEVLATYAGKIGQQDRWGK